MRTYSTERVGIAAGRCERAHRAGTRCLVVLVHFSHFSRFFILFLFFSFLFFGTRVFWSSTGLGVRTFDTELRFPTGLGYQNLG